MPIKWIVKIIPIKRHTHNRLTALCLGLPRLAGTRKVKPIWILLEQETVNGSGISWAICKSAPRSRQITTPTPHYSSFFTGQMPFLPLTNLIRLVLPFWYWLTRVVPEKGPLNDVIFHSMIIRAYASLFNSNN